MHIRTIQPQYACKVEASDKALGDDISINWQVYLIGLHSTAVLGLIKRANAFYISALFLLRNCSQVLVPSFAWNFS